MKNVIKKSCVAMLAAMSITQAQANEVPQSFTYQGKIYKSNGTDPLEEASVLFTIQVRSPDGSCLLFEESHLRDMRNTNGVFALNIGEGSNTNATTLSLREVFENTTSKLGSSSCVYTPTAGDTRKLRFSYNDGTTTVVLPNDQVLRSVPFAINASALGGLSRSQFIQTSANTTQVKVDGLTGYYTDLVALATGNSSLYAKVSDLPMSSGVLNLSSGGVKVSDAPAAADYAVNRNYADANLGGMDLDLSGLANGQSLMWNASQSKWQPAYFSAGTVTSITAGSGLSGGVITGSGTISLSNIGTAGTYTKVTTDAQGRVISGSNISVSDVLTAGSSTGQSLIWNGSAWASSFPNMSQLRSIASVPQMPTTCSTAQTLVYQTPSDTYACANIAVTSSQVSGLGGAAALSVGTAAGTVAAGNDSRIVNAVQSSTSAGGDLSGTFLSAVVAKIQGVLVSSTAPTNGQVLKYNSTTSRWEPSADNSNAGTVTSVAAGTGLTGGTITGSGTLSVDVGTSANKIVQLDSNGKLPALDASQLTNVPGAPMSNMQVYASAGTTSWVVPAGVKKVYVQIWGGGGGGAGGTNLALAGGGGGAGGYGADFVTVTPGASITVIVGAGGAGGTATNAGGSGSTTTFGSLTATGGNGGAALSQSPVAGGASAATININGGSGSAASPLSGVSLGGMGGTAGGGGGAGGGGSSVANVAGAAGSAPGGGGGGGGNGTLSGGAAGGAGGTGRIIIWY